MESINNFKVLHNNQVFTIMKMVGETLIAEDGRLLHVEKIKFLPMTGANDIDNTTVYLGDVIQSASNPKAGKYTIEFIDGDFWGVPKKITPFGRIVNDDYPINGALPLSLLIEDYDFRVVGDFFGLFT
ncbi:hypothetical protein ACFOQM_07340 [Paenibacillus sp. GCM10012307]|uniref:YopX protein domain-containing protein n=1 Tax=Paenibacillus roseus TaxID=2798579 RepID=A0A934MNK3_9BACL|nr:hypothetical protein [Paenibacillus roseus]MBJ6361106.1 hypothetical protein [Paenibacillus roseus]